MEGIAACTVDKPGADSKWPLTGTNFSCLIFAKIGVAANFSCANTAELFGTIVEEADEDTAGGGGGELRSELTPLLLALLDPLPALCCCWGASWPGWA